MEKEGVFLPRSGKEMKIIKSVCCRCKKHMGEKMGEVASGIEPISHGLCKDCLEETRKEWGLGKK